MQGRAKYTTHIFTLSEKKPPTNLKKWQQQRPFSPMCMFLVQLASVSFTLCDNQETFIFIIVCCYFEIVLTTNAVNWGVNTPPQKYPSCFFQIPHLNQQTIQSPPLGIPPLYWLFMNPSPLEIGYFSEPQKYEIFSSLTPFYIFIVTKFLVKISQFDFIL